MRTFIAIELGDPVRARMEEALSRMRRMTPGPRWVKSGSLHLTLAFLGEMADAGVPDVDAVLAQVASRHRPITLSAGGSGTFGPLSSPKVLWVALSGDLEALAALQGELAAELAKLGHAPDFEHFEPHITLARSRNLRGDPSLTRCADTLRDSSFGEVRVGEVSLFSSMNEPEGMRYSALARHPLGPQGNG